MSYDLFLFPDAFDADAIRAHFAARPNYRVEPHQAWYANAETGVYFGFDILESPQAEEGDEAMAQPHIAFNVNYFRPRTFALEAELEVAAFLARFPSRIDDPQRMGDGPYSREGFLEGWDYGNRCCVQRDGAAGHSAPGRRRPCAHRGGLGLELQPRAACRPRPARACSFRRSSGSRPAMAQDPEPAITWTFGVATIIPESLITRIVLVRQERPKLLKMFARNPDPKFEYKLISVEGGIRIAGVERGEVDGRPALFTPATGPLEMQALFSGVWSKPEFKLLAPEVVLGSDLVALGAGQ